MNLNGSEYSLNVETLPPHIENHPWQPFECKPKDLQPYHSLQQLYSQPDRIADFENRNLETILENCSNMIGNGFLSGDCSNPVKGQKDTGQKPISQSHRRRR